MKLHWEDIDKLAKAHHLESPSNSHEALTRYLQWWWCQKFSRPLKDPLLKSYSLDELCYEFLRYFYMIPENDPKKELEAKRKAEEENEWIRQQLSKHVAPKPVEQMPVKAKKSKKKKKDIPLPPDIVTKFE